MGKYLNEVQGNLATKICSFTGVREEVIFKHGIQFLLEHPAATGITKTQVEKINSLVSLIRQYNEVEFLKEEVTLDSSTKAGEYFKNRLKGKVDKEYFEISFLNTRNTVIATETAFEGTLDESPIYIREIIKAAINHDAKSIMIAHNHPGGSLQPSRADVETTDRVKAALNVIGIKLLDHIIVAGNQYISFCEKGFL